MSRPGDPRRSRAWRKLRDRVVREEPVCWLQLPGCTHVATTADHVVTVKAAPHLAMDRANLRGACASCNARRNDKTVEVLAQRAPALSFFDGPRVF